MSIEILRFVSCFLFCENPILLDRYYGVYPIMGWLSLGQFWKLYDNRREPLRGWGLAGSDNVLGERPRRRYYRTLACVPALHCMLLSDVYAGPGRRLSDVAVLQVIGRHYYRTIAGPITRCDITPIIGRWLSDVKSSRSDNKFRASWTSDNIEGPIIASIAWHYMCVFIGRVQ